MFDDRSKGYKNQFVPLDPIDVDLYKPFVGQKIIDELKWLAAPLENKVWANVNSTCVGGGVAEMLQSIIPFAKGLGVDCRWFVIEGSDEFFVVTKKFHNLLQGIDQPISMEEIFHAYLDTLHENTHKTTIVGHMVTVHDPQPAAMLMSGNIYGHILWRCHIDTSQASRRIWRFLVPYINHYHGAIFTSPEFVKSDLQIPTYEINPCIDPLKQKNKQYKREEALSILSDLFNEHNVDSDRPIVAAVSRYDIHKNQKRIIQAFKLMKENIPSKIKPLLIMIGNSASDDPEGAAMYQTILDEVGDDKDIHTWVNVENNNEVVGALMNVATCFVHVSTKEGFGLVVSEAMWQGTPVIGSRIGGIKKQVINGQTGYIVEPSDVDKIAKRMKTLLENKLEREHMGKNGIEHVRENFLLPNLIKSYVILMRYYLEVDNKLPEFRMNDLAYKEIMSALYGRTVWPISSDHLKKRLEAIWDGLR